MRLPFTHKDRRLQTNLDTIASVLDRVPVDLGDIATLSSADIDGLYGTATRARARDGLVATGTDGATPKLLLRRNGSWHQITVTVIP